MGFNTVQKYKHLLHVSDLVLCDGQTIDPSSPTDDQILSTRHIFCREEPTQADFSLWGSALSALCEGTTRIPYTLERYLCHPHLEACWYTNADSSLLYHNDEGCTSYQVFQWIPHS